MSLEQLVLQSGPATVIASGEATTFAGNGLSFSLVVNQSTARVELIFSSDPAIADVAVRTEALDDGYRLECVNFDGADGRGSSQPVLLGELGDSLVFFHFRVFLYGKTADRTIHYTFYQVPADALD